MLKQFFEEKHLIVFRKLSIWNWTKSQIGRFAPAHAVFTHFLMEIQPVMRYNGLEYFHSSYLRGTLMTYIQHYTSPLGGVLLSADELGLTGLWFDGQKYFAALLPDKTIEQDTPVLAETRRWLDCYFSGRKPDFTPPLHPIGSAFRQAVWRLLLEIPYGQTTTYGALARRLAAEEGLASMSAQAVGGAVGHNEISLIIPCHRVVGSNGSLTGYAGGIDKKIRLLDLEGADMSGLFIPKKGTAL